MKYVSAITIEGEETASYYAVEPLDSLCVTICDTEEIGARDFSGEQLHNIQAVGLSYDRNGLIVIRHSKKEAMLHKYIACASTVYSGYDVINSESDVVRFDLGNTDISGVVGYKDLVVDTDLRAIELCGLYGSVVLTTSEYTDNQRALTLYDLLCRMCDIIGLNVMKYNQVTFFSTVYKYKTVVSFLRSSEAMTFFTKMYAMDGVKNAVRC